MFNRLQILQALGHQRRQYTCNRDHLGTEIKRWDQHHQKWSDDDDSVKDHILPEINPHRIANMIIQKVRIDQSI